MSDIFFELKESGIIINTSEISKIGKDFVLETIRFSLLDDSGTYTNYIETKGSNFIFINSDDDYESLKKFLFKNGWCLGIIDKSSDRIREAIISLDNILYTKVNENNKKVRIEFKDKSDFITISLNEYRKIKYLLKTTRELNNG